VSHWKALYQPRVLSVIENKKWQIVNVFQRGSSPERSKCQITLLISAWDANDDSWWDHTLPDIRTFWPYEVELCEATNILCLDTMELDSLTGTIGMGSSVGVKDASESGTLGGAVKLKWQDGHVENMGITNHHVVADHRINMGT
jgi:hypothetical protein